MAKSKISSDLFARWLSDKIFSNGLFPSAIASKLHMAKPTIYRHMNGQKNPSFSNVVAYCWYFNKYFGCEEDPLEVWNLIE